MVGVMLRRAHKAVLIAATPRASFARDTQARIKEIGSISDTARRAITRPS